MASLHEAIIESVAGISHERPSSIHSTSRDGNFVIREFQPHGAESTYEIDPMHECMGAPVQGTFITRPNLSREQEEFMLAVLEKTLQVASTRPVSEEDARQDLESLQSVKSILEKFWESGSYLFSRAVEVMLNAQKEMESSALLGEAGIVEFFVSVLSANDVSDEVVIQALHILGDSCEKTESNKSRVVSQNGILPILYKLWNPLLVPIAIPVLCQICSGHEHSQQQAADLHTSRILIDLLSRTQPPGGGALTVLKQVCQLLDMMLKKRPEGYSNATSYVLLQLSLENEKDPEIYTYLASTAIEWLQLERVRLHFAEANNAMLLLSVLGTSYKRYSIAMKSISTWNDHSLSKYGSVEPRLRSAVIKTLAEVSTVPQFILHHTLESKFVETLQEWLLKGLPQLQACACVVLANMANSDVNRIFMLHHFRVHEILLPLLESSKPANLRASAAYFLKALLVSEACQQFLSNRPIVRIASCLWGTTDSPHLQYIGITLTKQAVEGSYNMLRQLLEPLSSDPDSPAHNKTFLSLLLRLWQDYYGYRQHERLTSEVAWTVVTVCSMLGSLSPLESPPDAEELQNRLLLNHPEVANPLIALLTEENQPVARSKALFVMALLAQKPLGLRIVGSMIDATEVSNLMSSLISRTGLRNTAEQGQMRSTCDHRNALILMSCLQKNKDSLDSRDKIEFLMKTLPDFDAESISGEIPTDTDDG